ncbi:MAG: phosphate ABC transporter ATP-binding protein [Verrucomicrobiaceae bacterium]|nr:phosphate ABC transporter ATP-binding protein [Verrucomicrobiaceae bacterium]
MVTPSPNSRPPLVQIRGMDFSYGRTRVLHDISLEIECHRVTALIGPSGCGKSTLLRCINRMNDRVVGARVTKGAVMVKGKNIHDADVDLTRLRRQVGMVFQKSNPFPKSLYENVAYGLRIHGEKRKDVLDEAVERALRHAVLWDELKDRLRANALTLSGGQQQRLCIARAIATRPEVLLLDEPCSALDPISTLKIEELMHQLSRNHTIIMVTHNMQQAARVSHHTAFLHLGRLVEFAPTEELFTHPREKLTESYLRGTFS